MQVEGETRIQQGDWEHTPEAVEQFVSRLAARFFSQRVAVALEQRRGALIFMLGKYEHLVLYPIHPNTVDHYRKSVYPSGAKSDPGDASLVLDLLCTHNARLRALQPDTVETLKLLVEARREAVDDKTRYLNRLTAQLKVFFPQILAWFSTPDTVVVGCLLQKWSTLDKLPQAPVKEVADFLRGHRIEGSRIVTLQELIAKAVAAVKDKAGAGVERMGRRADRAPVGSAPPSKSSLRHCLGCLRSLIGSREQRREITSPSSIDQPLAARITSEPIQTV